LCSTRDAAEGAASRDTTHLSLNAFPAGQRASTVRFPSRHRAINRASLGSTGTVLSERWARLSAGFDRHCDDSLAVLPTSAARHGARTPCSKVGHHAVNWAGLAFAETSFLKEWTGVSPMRSMSSNFSLTVLGASSTGFGAFSPTTEVGHFTVNWAGPVAAGLAFFERRASDSTMCNVNNHSASALLGALSTRFAAFGPCCELINLAIDRTRRGVAHASLAQCRADLAAVGTSLRCGARATLVSCSARFGAASVVRESRYNTIDGACLGVAVARCSESGARNTAELRSNHDLARAGTSSSTTTLGARTPVLPRRNLAVNGTTQSVASTSDFLVWTLAAAKCSRGYDSPDLGLGAGAT
jgi:hypothetical protein